MKNSKSIFAIALCVVIIASLFAMAACGVSQEEVDKLNQQIEDLNTKLAAAEKEAKDNKALLDQANAAKAAAEALAAQYKDKPIAGTDNVEYELSADGKYYIATGLKEGTDGSLVVIAPEFNGLPVTEISEEAFSKQNQDFYDKGEAISVIKNIVVPASVTTIGTKAFGYLTQLSTVVLQGAFDVETSGTEIFTECGMSYFKVPEGQKVLPAGFLRACTKLVTCDLSSIEEIGEGAFFSCSAIRDLVFPETLKRIDDNAFWAAFYMTNANLPTNLEYLGKEALYYCIKMTGDFVFGDKIKFVGSNALYNCLGLNSVTFAVTDGWYSCTDSEATEGPAVTFEGNVKALLTKPSSEDETAKGELYYKHN